MAGETKSVTFEDALKAMRKAKEDGRIEDARRIAKIVQDARTRRRAVNEPRTLRENLQGGGETALTLLTGSVAEPIAGLAGIESAISSAISGEDDVLAATAERIEQVRDAFTFNPRSEAGRDITASVAEPFQVLQEGAQRAGQFTQDVTGSPAAAAVVQSSIELAPGALGLRIRPKSVRSDIARVEAEARELGIDLGGKPAKKTQQIQEAGAQQASGVRGASTPDVAEAIRIARKQARDRRDVLYQQARQGEAFLDGSEFQAFPNSARTSLREAGFDIDDMPKVQSRIKELERLAESSKVSSVKLNALQEIRQRINKNRPASTDTSQAFALDTLKAQIDDYIQNQFNADMISGNPAAIKKWQDANKAHQYYVETFKENKVIRDLAEQNTTPEQMRQWIFGASITGAKKQAADTVRRVKELIGEDSPEFRALRQDALLDIVDPLLEETPNFKKFIKNYDRVVANNPSLVKELFPESATALRKLRDIAKGSDSVTPAQLNTRLERMGAVALFGHGIARAALKVNLAQKAFGMLKKIPEQGRRRQALANILGYDAEKPILTMKTAGIPAAGQAVIKETEQNPPTPDQQNQQ